MRFAAAGVLAFLAASVVPVSFTLAQAVAAPDTSAPQPTAAVAGGTVSGHVLCADTEHPARFAHVMLFGIPRQAGPQIKPDSSGDVAQAMVALNAMGGLNLAQTQTDLEGAYVAANVPPGDYYVFAAVPGYVQPKNMVQAAIEAGADPHQPIPGIPTVHVTPGSAAKVDVTIERGAAISGKVVWDDGSPVSGVMVTLLTQQETEKPLPTEFAMLGIANPIGGGGTLSISDDLGRFRISGMVAGEYLVKASLQTTSQFGMQAGVMNLGNRSFATPVTIFAPAAYRQADAKPVKLKAGEDHADEEVTINLGGLHSIHGRVFSAEDHHPVNSGMVQIVDAQDKTSKRMAGIEEDGSFTLLYVASGTYNLTVSDAADTVPSTRKPKGLVKFAMQDTVRSYQDGKLSVLVGDSDVVGQNLELAPAKTVKKNLDLNDLMQ